MTTENSFPYTAGFKLFRADGLQVHFTVNGKEPVDHMTAVDGYIAAMIATGYAVNPPGLESGERVEAIGGWVLGETSHDQPCVYLYGANPGLQYRIVTVYEERIPDLPFAVDVNGKRWMGAAPTRDMAAQKGYLSAVADFDIVLTPHEYKTKDDGSPVMIFGRVKVKPPTPATTPPAPQPKSESSGNGNKPATALEDDEQTAHDTHPKEWFATVATLIPRYKNEGAGAVIGATKKITGRASLPATADERVELYRALKQHAAERDAEEAAAPADLLEAVGENVDSAHNAGAFDTK